MKNNETATVATSLSQHLIQLSDDSKTEHSTTPEIINRSLPLWIIILMVIVILIGASMIIYVVRLLIKDRNRHHQHRRLSSSTMVVGGTNTRISSMNRRQSRNRI